MKKRILTHPKSRCTCCGKKYPLVKLRFNPDTEHAVRDSALRQCGKQVPSRPYAGFDTEELLCPRCYKRKYK